MGTRKQVTPEFTREAVQVGKRGSRSASELVRELARVTEERAMLQKAAAYFARMCGEGRVPADVSAGGASHAPVRGAARQSERL